MESVCGHITLPWFLSYVPSVSPLFPVDLHFKSQTCIKFHALAIIILKQLLSYAWARPLNIKSYMLLQVLETHSHAAKPSLV